MTNLRAIAGLSDMAEAYDGFILDLWGLVHDGATPYPPSRDAFLALKAAGKEYEFHMYPGAGHGFFYYDRAAYRQEQAVDGWNKLFSFFSKHLGS